MDNPLPGRIGTFFILLGCILLILFVSSVIGKGVNGMYLLLGVIAMFLGISLRRRSTAQVPSARFGTIQKIQERNRKRREEKQQKEDQNTR